MNRNALSRMLRSLLGMLAMSGALLAGAGCQPQAHSDDAAAGKERIEREEAVASLSVEMSFLDRGLKAIVFSDGSGFAWKLVETQNQKHAFVLFQLPAQQHEKIIAAFNKHQFLSLPKKLSIDATDGTSEWLTIADQDDFHRVYHYLAENKDFAAVRETFVEVVEPYLPPGKAKHEELSAAEFAAAISARIDKLPAKSPIRKAASEWLDLQIRNLLGRQLMDRDTANTYLIPGDGAAVYRELRQGP